MESHQQPRYAGFWIRALALFIDSVICLIPLLVFESVAPLFGGIIVSAMYQPFFESSRLMATPGKALLGLRVSDLDLNRISFGRAFARKILSILSGVFLCLGYLFVLFTQRKQTMHDLIIDTIVTYGPHSQDNYLEAWTDQVEEVFSFRKSQPTASAENSKQANSVAQSQGHTSSSAQTHLAHLDQLLSAGLITEEEYKNLQSRYPHTELQ